MYHWIVGLGLLLGIADIFLYKSSDGEWITVFLELLTYFGRVIGTCVVFYVFFLLRMLGAGDIKLMAVCVGSLGVRAGCFMIFYGFLVALAAVCIQRNVWKHGLLMIRGAKIRLAPYLFAGFILMMLGGYS